MLQLKTTKKIGQFVLMILLLVLLNKIGVAQTSTLKIPLLNAEIKNAKGGICGNVPQAYGTSTDGFVAFEPDNFNLATVKTSQWLKKAFESIPKEKYFRAKAREKLDLTIDFVLKDTTTFIGKHKANGFQNNYVHLGYKTPDGFVMQELDAYANPVFKLENANQVFGGLNVKLRPVFNKDLFKNASEAAFLVFSSSVMFIESNTGQQIHRTFSFMMPFVVEGIVDQAVDSLGLVTEPQIPYMVLHDPPGDGSFTAMEEAKTVCRSLETSFANDETNTTNASLKLGYAGSVGVIVVVDIEIYVELSGSLSIGDFKMQSKSNESCLTLSKAFATSDANGFKDGGDLFVGYGYDVAYGVYRQIVIDDDSCKARIEKNLVYRPINTPESIREFALDESGILAEIERLQKNVDDNSLPIKTRADAQNQISVWNQVLQLNEKNKNEASVSIDPNVSFSGKTGGFTRYKSMEVSETKTITVEHYIAGTAGLQGVVNIGGSGFSAGYEYATEKRFGETTSQTNANSTVLSYTLIDGSEGDIFNVDVYRDLMYGTPVFKLKAGTISSCPYEGGYQRDQPKLKHNGINEDNIILEGNPVGSSASFKIDLCNESNETRIYNLALNAASNLNGAVISASGVPLNGNDAGQVYSIPANSCLQDLIVEVKQLSSNSPLSYPDLELYLYSSCDDAISSSVFASVYFGNATSVNDLADNNKLTVYPNPTSGILNIKLLKDYKINGVKLIDATGRLLRYEFVNDNAQSHQMDVSNLPSGIYSLQVQSDEKIFVKKIMIQ